MRFLFFVLMLIFMPRVWAKNPKDFHLIKEIQIPLVEQISSIYITEKFNSPNLLKTIMKLNRVKNVEDLNKKLKIKIPSPLKQRQCNFVRTQSGLVNFKYHVKSEEERLEILKSKVLKCNYYDVHQNYIRRTDSTPVSTIIYSLFLKDIWAPKGVMSQISRINGIKNIEEYKTRSIFMIPPIAYSNGCNYFEYPSGKIKPLVLVNRKVEREELAVAFKCVGAREFPTPEAEIEEKPKPEPPKIIPPKHHLSLLAGTTFHYDQSDVSDVEVEIISGYSIITRYWYDLKEKRRINLNGNLENYLEVKNRDLRNNLLWRKTLNYEKLFSEKFGYTVGLYEDWYFDNIEVDEFVFTSSLLVYAGLTYHDNFKDKYQFDMEIGAVSPLDLFAKESFSSGFFSHQYLTFPLYGYNAVLGAAFDYHVYERHTSQNYSLQAGLKFSF